MDILHHTTMFMIYEVSIGIINLSENIAKLEDYSNDEKYSTDRVIRMRCNLLVSMCVVCVVWFSIVCMR